MKREEGRGKREEGKTMPGASTGQSQALPLPSSRL